MKHPPISQFCLSKSKRVLRALLGFGLPIAIAACGAGAERRPERAIARNGDAYPGIGRGEFALLSTNCALSRTGLTVSVNADETVLVTLDSDGNVSVNSTQAAGPGED